MKKGQDNELINLFSEQLKLINDIQLNLDCDLYVCFEEEEEGLKLKRKLVKLQKMKVQLIKMFASLIGEF